MGNQQPAIRSGAGSCSCSGTDVHAYDAEMLRHLVSQFDASQIMLGTDYPFACRDHSPAARQVPVQ